MIVDDVTAAERPGERLERAARVRWHGGEVRLRVEVPAPAAAPADDASALLALTLVTAMRRREPVLEIDGDVCPRLLAAVGEIGTFLETWDPTLRPPEVRAGSGARPARADGVGCFLSRGVDSTFSAAVARHRPVTELVHVVGLEPRHDAAVRAAEVEACGVMAAALGRPLSVIETNVRELTDPVLGWHDVFGSVLAGLGLSMAGRIGRMIIPSSGCSLYTGAYGSSPLVDALWSTDAVEVAHDSVALTRVGKLAALARQRPDLLAELKVCWIENRPDNCGRCAKCVFTMCGLHAAGGLAAATRFPDAVEPDLVRTQLPEVVHTRAQWAAIIATLGDEPADRRLRAAMEEVLDRVRLPDAPERRRRLPWRRARPAARRLDPLAGLDARHHERLVSLTVDGHPAPAPDPAAGASWPAGHIRLMPA